MPMMENNPGESVRNNVEGTRIIADLAVKYRAKKLDVYKRQIQRSWQQASKCLLKLPDCVIQRFVKTFV